MCEECSTVSRAVDKLASVLLYEGYVRSERRPDQGQGHRSRAPWSLGNLLPRSFSEEQPDGDPWWMRTECLLRGKPSTRISVSVRFLHLRHMGPSEQVRDADERVLGLPTLSVSRLLEQGAHLDF